MAIAHWVAQKGDAIEPADMKQVTQVVRKLRRGTSVWTALRIVARWRSRHNGRWSVRDGTNLLGPLTAFAHTPPMSLVDLELD